MHRVYRLRELYTYLAQVEHWWQAYEEHAQRAKEEEERRKAEKKGREKKKVKNFQLLQKREDGSVLYSAMLWQLTD